MNANETKWTRVAPGDYDADDGARMWQVPDVNPPAWNVEAADGSLVVNGAASMRDAKALYEDAR